MKNRMSPLCSNAAVLLVITAINGVVPAYADDQAVLDTTPESAIKLIRSMVDHGALTPVKAQAMIRDVEFQAAAARQTALVSDEVRAQIKREVLAEVQGQMAADIKRQVLAELTGAASSPTLIGAPPAEATAQAPDAAGAKGKPRVVRVPYVPESMRREIREQLKQEVLAQAKEERWGNPNTLPEWLDRFSFEGDVRLRYDSFRLGQANSAPGLANYLSGTGLTRAPDFVGAGAICRELRAATPSRTSRASVFACASAPTSRFRIR